MPAANRHSPSGISCPTALFRVPISEFQVRPPRFSISRMPCTPQRSYGLAASRLFLSLKLVMLSSSAPDES